MADGTESAVRLSAATWRDMFRWFWRYTRGNRRWMVLGGLASLAVAGCELGTVVLFDAVTDRVLEKKDLHAFWPLAQAWLGVVVAAAVAMFAGHYLLALSGERFALLLRDAVIKRIQQLPPDYLGKQRLGDLMVRLTEDIAVIEGIVCSGAVSVVTALLSMLLFGGAAFRLSWRLAAVACVSAPVFWLATKGFSRPMRRAAERQRLVTGRITSAIEESLANQAMVQAFNQQTGEFRRLHDAGQSWLRANMNETRLSATYGPLTYIIESAGVLAVFGFGAWQLCQGTIALGGLIAFAMLLTYVYPPLQQLGGLPLAISEASSSVERITEILTTPRLVTESTRLTTRRESIGLLEAQDVTFCYPGARRPVLDHLSFRIWPGQILAITGPSGSGKSTIAKLLLRFYDPLAGRIMLDGIDIRDMTLKELRDNITLMQQETLLFSGTVWDNIQYAKPEAPGREVIAAAKVADAHDFIRRLPDGYDSQVGQRGRLLSGGQRQRISLARAILRDSPVLVLDEPTTGLSPADARNLMKTLTPVIRQRTTILITHDRHLAAMADHVVTISQPAGTPSAR
jgi:ATP-binding cassette, subfamily B, bacterial